MRPAIFCSHTPWEHRYQQPLDCAFIYHFSRVNLILLFSSLPAAQISARAVPHRCGSALTQPSEMDKWKGCWKGGLFLITWCFTECKPCTALPRFAWLCCGHRQRRSACSQLPAWTLGRCRPSQQRVGYKRDQKKWGYYGSLCVKKHCTRQVPENTTSRLPH